MTSEDVMLQIADVIGAYNGIIGNLVGMLHANGIDMRPFAESTSATEMKSPVASIVVKGAGAAMLAAINGETPPTTRPNLTLVPKDD